MNKFPRKTNKFELQEINVEKGPEALANPLRNLRPLPRPGFDRLSTIQHQMNHHNREQVIHDIAFPHASYS